VKFLVDNQLPGALCKFLQEQGHDAVHVLDLQMDEKADFEIWDFARAEQRIVISKDEDFVHIANRPTDNGSLLWVRIGNCRKAFLLSRFQQSMADIEAAFQAGQRIVEIR
jgi:predicted nuclease of predicted toxin-antitoxin system